MGDHGQTFQAFSFLATVSLTDTAEVLPTCPQRSSSYPCTYSSSHRCVLANSRASICNTNLIQIDRVPCECYLLFARHWYYFDLQHTLVFVRLPALGHLSEHAAKRYWSSQPHSSQLHIASKAHRKYVPLPKETPLYQAIAVRFSAFVIESYI